MTWDQINLIFDLTCQKLEVELATVKLDARARLVATEEKAKLQQKLMVKELEALVAAAITTATDPMAISQKRLLAKEDGITSKVLPKVMSITLCFTGLS